MLLLGTATDGRAARPAPARPTLLFRLFHEDGVRVFTPHGLRFGCRCVGQRVETMLRRFPRDDLEDMRDDDGDVVVTCQFCNIDFRFDDAQLARLHGKVPRERALARVIIGRSPTLRGGVWR